MQAFFSHVLRQSVLVNILFGLCLLIGLFSLTELPLERYPNVKMGKVLITTVYPGASPKDVEALVTREIEEALEDMESVEFIRASSFRGRSSVVVKFIDDSDYEALFDELRLKVLSVMNELPQGIDPPEFTEVDVDMWLPAVMVNLVGERSNRALSLMAEELKLALRSIEGVQEVDITGDYTREFQVSLDPDRLASFGLTFNQVAGALEESNVSVPAGDFTAGSGEYSIVVDERFRSRQEVVQTVLRRDADGSLVRLSDVVSRARMDYRDPFVMTSVNGQNCVSLKIIKEEAGNVLDIVPAVKQELERFRPQLEQEGVEFVLTQDQRVYIDDSLRTLGSNLLVGVGLVALMICLFMGLRNAVLIMVGIPFAFLVTMIFMWLTGNSLNEITLFSFVLVSGIIVDDAIVVLENIYRHFQEGEGLQQAVTSGAAEVAWPVIAATTTTVAAFLPMLLMTGSTGEFFAQIPIAISAAIAASLFECLVILPLHYRDWPGLGRNGSTHRRTAGAALRERLMSGLRLATEAIVSRIFRHRGLSLGLVLVAFLLSLGVVWVSASGRLPLIRIEFFPEEYVYYYVEMQGPVGTPLERTRQMLDRATGQLLPGKPEQLTSVTGLAGFYLTEDYQPIYGSNLGHLVVELPDKGARNFPNNPDNDPAEHLSHVRERMERFVPDDWQVRVRPEESGPPTGKDLTVRSAGPNPDNVLALAGSVRDFLRHDPTIGPHLVDLASNRGQMDRVVRFRVLEEKAAEFGLPVGRVAALAGSVLDGRYVGEFRSEDEDVDLKLRLDSSFLVGPEDGLEVPVVQHPSGPVRLRDVVRMETSLEPNKLNRYQNNRSVTLTADIQDGAPLSIPQAVRLIKDHYAQVKGEFPGAELSFAGEFESTRRSYTSLSYAFAVAVLIIYMILAAQFRSYLQPLIILSAIVFSLIGVVVGKLATQGVFTVSSFIALVGVAGVVVNDSLVLVDFINVRYRAGMPRREAVYEGVRIRLRPILLTTLTTTLGLAPMALGIPAYSIVWGPMASTFVTGLCTATFLTLFIVPVQWDLLTGLAEGRQRRKERLASSGRS
jgi:HAE1 family hydrophobic/amphiphilic exporter-1